jgi:hypothetical protein
MMSHHRRPNIHCLFHLQVRVFDRIPTIYLEYRHFIIQSHRQSTYCANKVLQTNNNGKLYTSYQYTHFLNVLSSILYSLLVF